MLLRELKEVGFLMELDGHNFQQALQDVGANIHKIDKSDKDAKDKDTKVGAEKLNPSGILQTDASDAMVRPVIAAAVEEFDQQAPLVQSKINKTLTTPELKSKCIVAVKTAIAQLEYFRRELAEGLDKNTKIAAALKGHATSVFEYKQKLAGKTMSPLAVARAKNWSSIFKGEITDALMFPSSAQSFLEARLETLDKNIEEAMASKKNQDAFVERLAGIYGYFENLEKNLKATLAMISPDRDIDKADASA